LKKIDVKKLDPRKLDLKKIDAKTARLGLAGLLVVIAVLIGAIALLSDDSGGGSSESSETAGESKGVALSASELVAKAGSLGGPAYWIGPRAGTTSYELSVTPDGRIYVRYLTGGAEAGDPKPDFLTIGTYPVPEAAQALQDATTGAAGSQTLTQHEGFEVLSSPEATNAYVVFDDQPEIQVEVFSPQRGEASQLAGSGALKPLG
jgi:hypothetical protein